MIKRILILSLLLLVTAPLSVLADSKLLQIDVDRGIALTLPGPAASVFIANPDIADVQVMSPTSIMIFGKRTGETTFMATDSAGRTLDQRTVDVTQDLAPLRLELNAAIPGNKIQAQSIPNGIILTGDAHDPSAVADAFKIAQRYVPSNGDIINRVRVTGSNQIQIRVRFAEVQRTINNSLGIDWGSAFSFGGFVLGLVSGNPVVNVTSTGITANNGISTPGTTSALLTTPLSRTNNAALATPNDGISFSRQGSHFNINSVIDALAQDGLVTILAEPNLTAMSGETANFLAGGQFPIPIPQGNGTISIQFQSYGISLAFTPTLVGDNRISLHVKPEVSELTSTGSIILDNISVPALTTRRAETTVEVASGQSFAIAGLLDNDQAQTVNKYPILGDMPVLGALFRDDQFQNGQTELVIIITPYIVKPTDEQLALPTDGFSPPSESERLLGLRYSSSDPNARPMSGTPGAVLAAPAVSAAPVVPVEPVPPVMAPAPAMPMKPETMNTAPDPSPVTQTPNNFALKVADPVADPAPNMPALVPAPQPNAQPVTASPVLLNGAATAAPVNLNPGGSAPAGSGGFTLE